MQSIGSSPCSPSVAGSTAAATIAIFAVGSTGDVLPYLALAVGLRDHGYSVRFMTHARFVADAEKLGIRAIPVQNDPRDTLYTKAGRKWLGSGSDPLAFGLHLRNVLDPLLEEFARVALTECADAECIIASGLACFAAVHVAEKLSIPVFPAWLQPATATTEFRNPFVRNLVPDGSLSNWLTHVAYSQGYRLLFRSSINRMRMRVLDLPPISWQDGFPETSGRFPVLYGFSSSVVPKPRSWSQRLHVTGYWFPPTDRSWLPPPSLVDFLQSGSPPVCVGFGSMTDHDPERLTGIALAALKRAGRRGILLTGWGALNTTNVNDDVLMVESVPHEWLFRHASAVVHHGGAGTTAAVLRAGLPSVIVPYFGDQFFWGDSIHRLGASPPPIARRRISSESLGAAIEQALSHPSISARARSVSEQLRAEDGVQCAVRAIQHELYVGSGIKPPQRPSS